MNIEPLELRIAPATFIVNTLSDVPDPADALITLREAVARANEKPDADTIKFAPDVAGTITLINGEMLISETLTILGGGKITLSGNDVSRIFRVENPDQVKAHPLTVNGLRFTLGQVTGDGAAISSNEGVTIINCLFDRNEATGDGAVLSLGTTTVINSHFNDNSGGSGGALFVNSTTKVTITGCVFNGNSADILGGAVRIDANNVKASVAITGSIFTQNEAGTSGGGALLISGGQSTKGATKITIAKSQFVENSAQSVGGGLRIDGGALSLSEVLVSGNESTQQAGGGMSAGIMQKLTVVKSVFAGNTAAGVKGGGGVFLVNPVPGFTATFKDCQFVENEATNGPGGGLRVDLTGGKLTITGSQFAGNVSGDLGGGLSVLETDASASAVLTGNRFAGNEASFAAGLALNSAGPLTLKTNVIAGNESTGSYGGASLGSGVKITLSGNAIIGNRAGGTIGGLGISGAAGATFSLSGDRILHNEVAGSGVGGLVIFDNISGPSITGTIGKTVRISGNISDDFIGGVRVAAPDTVTLLAAVSGNFVRNDPANPQTSGAFVNTPPVAVSPKGNLVVENRNDSGPGSLRDAIAKANENPNADRISFAPGVSGTILLASQLEVTETLTIFGGGNIVLSGQGMHRILEASSSDSAKDHPLTLDGLIFTDGNESAASSSGGAVLSDVGLTLRNCLFVDNRATQFGGAVSVLAPLGAVTVQDTHFSDNSVVSTFTRGGALSVSAGKTVTISASVFDGNVADHAGGSNTGGGGGAEIFSDTKVVVSKSLFANNRAADLFGGGLAAFGGAMKSTITDTSFIDNQAGGNGGGLAVFRGDFALSGVIALGNDAGTAAASDRGGGIAVESNVRRFTIAKSLVAANTAAAGAGLWIAGGDPDHAATVSTSRFLGNVATAEGGGLFAGSTAGKLSVSASLFADNTALNGAGLAAKGSGVLALTGNTFAGNTAQTGAGLWTEGDGALALSKNALLGNHATLGGGGAVLESIAKITLKTNSILGNGADSGVGGLFLTGATGATFTTSGDVIAFNVGTSTGGLHLGDAIAGVIAKNVKITGNVGSGAIFGGGVTQESTRAVQLLATILGNLNRTDPAKNETFGLFAP